MSNTSCTCNQTSDDLLTVSDAASMANVSEKTVRRRIWSRELPHHRIGSRSIRIRRGDLDEWMQDGFVPALSEGEVLRDVMISDGAYSDEIIAGGFPAWNR